MRIMCNDRPIRIMGMSRLLLDTALSVPWHDPAKKQRNRIWNYVIGEARFYAENESERLEKNESEKTENQTIARWCTIHPENESGFTGEIETHVFIFIIIFVSLHRVPFFGLSIRRTVQQEDGKI